MLQPTAPNAQSPFEVFGLPSNIQLRSGSENRLVEKFVRSHNLLRLQTNNITIIKGHATETIDSINCRDDAYEEQP